MRNPYALAVQATALGLGLALLGWSPAHADGVTLAPVQVVARLASTPMASTPAPAVRSRPSTPPIGARLVEAARTRLGAPYRYGAAGPSAFDCSGLVMWAAARVDVHLPHNSGAQYAHLHGQHHAAISVRTALHTIGALLYRGPGRHVAISLGDGKHVIEARGRGKPVAVTSGADHRAWTHAARLA